MMVLRPNQMANKVKYLHNKRALEITTLDEVSTFLFALGNQFLGMANAEAAFDCFSYSLDLNPQNQPAVHNLGAVYYSKGNYEGALRMFKESLRMDPTRPASLTALAEVHRKLGNLDEAESTIKPLLANKDVPFDVLSIQAMLSYDKNNLAQALEYNDRVIEKVPGDAKALLNRTLIKMLYGDWVAQWPQYEYFLTYRQNPRMQGLSVQDSWAGQEMPGKTLMVVSDQGHGDAIQFGRFLGLAKEKGKFERLIYVVPPDLVSLLSRLPGVDEVVGFGERDNVKRDTFSSLLGIMRVLEVSPATARVGVEPLTYDLDLLKVWRARILDSGFGVQDPSSKFRIGIAWAGDPKHGNDFNRSLPFSKVLAMVGGAVSPSGESLKPPPNVQFYSFQVGPKAKALGTDPQGNGWGIVDLASDFRHFDDTACAMECMDLMICVDTAVAHLAGCLGKRCWVLLSKPNEWRWLLNLTDSVWYGANFTLVHQPTPKDWDSVVAMVLRSLNDVPRAFRGEL